MRFYINCFFLFLSSSLLASELENEQTFKGVEAEKFISGAEIVRMYNYTSIPAFVKFRNPTIPEYLAIASIKKMARFDSKTDLKFIKKEQDDLGFTHLRYVQTYKGYEVFGSGYIIHIKNGLVSSVNGLLYDHISINENLISKNEAFQLALKALPAKVYKWEIPEEEANAKHEFEVDKIRTSPTYYPSAQLKIIPPMGNFYIDNHAFRLCYVYDIYAHEPMDRKEIFIDAENKSTVFENHKIHHGNSNGTAITGYSGSRAIISDSTSPTNFRLRETGRGNGIETYNLVQSTNYGAAVDFLDSNNIWNNVNAAKDQYATDAHWGAEMTYDYLWLKHNRNSIDNAGFLLKSYIHHTVGVNAFWDGIRMTYGDGNATYNPLTSMDVAGHEIGHGWTSNTSDLVYSYQSGALNESFSDILGVATDFFSRPGLANWLIGDGMGGGTFRSLSNPNAFGQPDTYLGTSWWTSAGDNGGVHYNSGVQNFWFYLLTNGGSGTNDIGNAYSVQALGIDSAAKIAYRNNTFYLITSSQYADARFYAIQSAVDLYGSCSKGLISTTNAWHAVGVGLKFDSSVTADFIALNPINCGAPQTMKFKNFSQNGSTFKWKFGTGDSSTLKSPNYVYTSNGSYTVTLIADGGACGIDTTIKIAYISLDKHNDCIYNIGDTNFTNQCNATLYDDGGALTNYNTNEDLLLTISPTGATSINFTFPDFDMEGFTACGYDYLQFHNGTTTAAASLGKYCNTTLPPASLSSGANATLRHVSDPFQTGRGYEIKWQCTVPSSKPNVRFSASTLNSCDGIIVFKDESYNTPTSWAWNFGDGSSSSLQHPTYTYPNSGVYNVRLIATNAFGADTFVKLAYITIARPAQPIAADKSRCGTGTLNFTTTSSGTIQWFDSLTSTTVLATGTSFTTPSLSTTRNYYLESMTSSPTRKLGPTVNTIGAGGNHTSVNSGYLIFDAAKPFKLVSVKVYATNTRDRRFQLKDKFGAVLDDTIINVANGTQVVNLNFDVPMGQDFRLAIHKDSIPNLYRNTGGATYPYKDANSIVTIKNNSASATTSPNSYFYFYDWVIKESDCKSTRKAVQAKIQSTIVLANKDTTKCGLGNITLTPNGNDIDSIYWTTGSIAASSITVNPTVNTNYIYTAFNGCGSKLDTINVIVLTPPSLSVSNDTTICAGQAVKLKATSSSGVNWTSIPTTDTMPSVSPIITTIYPVETVGGCLSVKDTVKVTVTPKVSLSTIAFSGSQLCIGSSVTATSGPSGGSWSVSSGSGTINVSSGVLASSAPTTIFVKYIHPGISGTSCPDTITGSIASIANPTAIITSSSSPMCEGATRVLNATPSGGTFSIVSGGGTIAGSTLTATSAGTLKVKYNVIVAGCADDTVIDIIINASPIITFTPPTSICPTTTTTLTATPVGGAFSIVTSGGGSIGGSTYTAPSSSGSYVLKYDVSNMSGCSSSVTQPITILSTPTISAMNDTTICQNDSITLTAVSNGTITWKPINIVLNSVKILPTQTQYIAEGSNSCGLVKDTVNLTINNLPTLAISNDTTICNGSTIGLKANSNYTPFWSSLAINDTIVNISPTLTTIYPIEVNSSCGNLKDTIRITVIPLPSVSARMDTILCEGISINLFATSAQPITWQPMNLTQPTVNVSPISTTTYIAQATNMCGTATDTVRITVLKKPIYTKSPNTTVCIPLSTDIKATTTNSILFWPTLSSIDTVHTVSPIVNTIYPFRLTNICGIFRDTIKVNAEITPLISVNQDTTICAGNQIVLKASSNLSNISWSPINQLGNNILVKPGKNMTYYGQVANFCGTVSDSIVVTLDYKPYLNLSNDTSICKGDSVILSGLSNASYQWIGQLGSAPSIKVSPIISKYFTAKAQNTCGFLRDSVFVFITPKPTAVASKTQTNSTVNFLNQSLYTNSYLWNFGDSTTSTMKNPVKTYLNPGTYPVELIVTNACDRDTLKMSVFIAGSSSIAVNQDELISIYPNPTSDKVQVRFSRDYKEVKVELYDQVGKKLISYSTVDSEFELDLSRLAIGTYHLKISNSDLEINRKLLKE